MSVTLNVQPTDQSLKIAPSPWADRAKKVAIGCVTWLVMGPIAGYVATLFDPKIIDASGSWSLWNKFENGFHPLLVVAWKVAVLVMVVVIGPIGEEWLFREQLQVRLEKWTKIPAVRICMNGFLFGLIHVWRFPTWASLPKFVITTFGGCVAATLREKTGDIIAPSAAHILHNGVVMSVFLKG